MARRNRFSPVREHKRHRATESLYPVWQVRWWNFTGRHDWIGRRPARRGRMTTAKRIKPPERESRNFERREDAEEFAANLRRNIGEDQVVVQIVSMRALLPPKPEERRLPGNWPLQRRTD